MNEQLTLKHTNKNKMKSIHIQQHTQINQYTHKQLNEYILRNTSSHNQTHNCINPHKHKRMIN